MPIWNNDAESQWRAQEIFKEMQKARNKIMNKDPWLNEQLAEPYRYKMLKENIKVIRDSLNAVETIAEELWTESQNKIAQDVATPSVDGSANTSAGTAEGESFKGILADVCNPYEGPLGRSVLIRRIACS